MAELVPGNILLSLELHTSAERAARKFLHIKTGGGKKKNKKGTLSPQESELHSQFCTIYFLSILFRCEVGTCHCAFIVLPTLDSFMIHCRQTSFLSSCTPSRAGAHWRTNLLDYAERALK